MCVLVHLDVHFKVSQNRRVKILLVELSSDKYKYKGQKLEITYFVYVN